MKKLMMVLGFLIVLSSFAFSLDFAISVAEPGSIYVGDTGEFVVSIKNLGVSDWFSVSVLGTSETKGWITIEKPNVKIDNGETKDVKIWITPSLESKSGTYGFIISVSSADGSIQEKQVYLTVKQKKVSGILKDFSKDCAVCDSLINIRVVAENLGTSNLDDAKIIIKVGGLKKEEYFSLGAGESKEFDKSFTVSNFKHGTYDIRIEFYNGNTLLDTKEASFFVPRIENIETEEEISNLFFGRSVRVIATNLGNYLTEAEIKSQVSGTWWVTYSGPEPTSKLGNVWTWAKNISPGETVEITYLEIYWPILAVIILIVLGSIFSYFYFSSFSVRKRMYKKGNEFTIVLEIKNKWKRLNNIVVKDYIPNNFSLTGHFESLKPILKKSPFNTELTWKLGTLRPNEERVLHYRIKPNSENYNTTILPGAEVKGRCREKIVFKTTNKVTIPGVPKKEENRIVVEEA